MNGPSFSWSLLYFGPQDVPHVAMTPTHFGSTYPEAWEVPCSKIDLVAVSFISEPLMKLNLV